MKRFLLIALLLTASLLTACFPRPVTLTVMTHDSFAVSADVVAAFEQANSVKVVFLKSGDAGEALNKAILAQNAPLADVFYGVDNTFLSRALEAGIFEPYDSPLLANVPDEFQLDATHQLLPVDYGDVCLNYDKAWFAAHSLPVPGTLEDLLKPEYNGLLVVENPATSSPGLAFLLATVAKFGDPGYLDYWRSLRANGLVVADDWNAAYYVNFSGSSGRGPQPLVLSYASSPAAEVFYADPPVDAAPTAAVLGPGACFRQIEFVGILKGTPNRALAEKFVDFMLGVQFQQDIPLQMFMYPVNPDAQLPDVFVQWAPLADQPAALDSAIIAANRDRWIADWTDAVLR
ncbi:MAG: thiamine transport system substrate-binding protein [Anaerolineaceae bacterium]|nr:MAG: thiamine transport system substrate-binding protein [Anaerolineaceae bacterium]